jgi:hypothetical protein
MNMKKGGASLIFEIFFCVLDQQGQLGEQHIETAHTTIKAKRKKERHNP